MSADKEAKDKPVSESETSADKKDAAAATQSEDAKSAQDQTLSTDTPTQRPPLRDGKAATSQPGAGKGTKTANSKEQKTDGKNSKNKKDTAATKPTLDQNANAKTSPKPSEQSKQKGNSLQEQKKQNNTIAASDRLTIYFHAVLSKDFKFDPDEDRVFIRAGCGIGTWNENAVEDLGEHGFLVQGSLTTKKKDVESESIPYKYVVYKHKKVKYEYEFIYKLDSTQQTVNRCLFVKPHILTEKGDWHQYDDIVCVEPPTNVLKRLKETIKDTLWPDQKRDLIKGRTIAGYVMLETIFDLLRSWDVANLKGFLVQLNQFFHVYGEPFVYEDRQKKWNSLGYGKDDVKRMLKDFMLENVIPQASKDGDKKMLYIQNHMRAAVIMLCVCKQYFIGLTLAELNPLCTALCLPKLNKDDFLQYWSDFSQDVPILKKALINLMKSHSHLMEVDVLLVRSCLYLMPFDGLEECLTHINTELLDVLHIFTNKSPQEISYSNFQENAVDQIEFYCTKIEQLNKSHPLTAASVEKCALEAVTSLCQSEGRLLERLQINWKFGKLISTIIEKSWPKDRQGNYREDEEVVLQHLLSWTAAKNIFQLYGIFTIQNKHKHVVSNREFQVYRS
uniref:Uncharacterized protein n=1 Tax=Labrus bergylta TaxID=56723 RepID=A0A3Q3GL01_9LABR